MTRRSQTSCIHHRRTHTGEQEGVRGQVLACPMLHKIIYDLVLEKDFYLILLQAKRKREENRITMEYLHNVILEGGNLIPPLVSHCNMQFVILIPTSWFLPLASCLSWWSIYLVDLSSALQMQYSNSKYSATLLPYVKTLLPIFPR